TGRLVSTCQEKHGHVTQAVLNEDGSLLATTGWDDKLRLWDATTGKLLLTKSEGFATYVGTDRRHRLWSTDRQGAGVRLWELVRGGELTVLLPRTVALTGDIGLGVSPDGRLLATTHEDGIRLWDLGTAQEVAYLPSWRTFSVVFHAERSALFSSGESGVYRWPLATDGAGCLRVGPPQSLGVPATRLGSAGGRYLSLSAD